MKTFAAEKNSWPFLNFFNLFSSKIMFLNSHEPFQSLISEYFLRRDLEVFRNFLFYRFLTNQSWLKKTPKTVLKTRLKTKETTLL
jgi:hypothetical protein